MVLSTYRVAVLAAVLLGDIILSPAKLNETLQNLTRLKQKGALVELGLEADAFASLLTEEVAAHGNQEKRLIDVGLARAKELGVSISYNRDKKRFYYDGQAFEQYLKRAPRGKDAARAKFKLIELRFYQSDGSDLSGMLSAAAAKKEFLTQYPKFEDNAEINLFLAIDYRDIYRRHAKAKDAANRAKYEQLTVQQMEKITREFPGTEQAEVAAQLLDRFRQEISRK